MAIKIFHAVFDNPHSLLDLQRAKQWIILASAGTLTGGSGQNLEKNSGPCVQYIM